MKEYKFRITVAECKPYYIDVAKIVAAGSIFLEAGKPIIEQYIATDANGAEVYEGDKIEILGYIDDEGEKWRFSQEVIVTAQMTNLEEIEAGLAIKAGE